MNNVVVLPSARLLDAQTNLDRFVRKARDCTAFGDIDFENFVWKVQLLKTKRASSAHSTQNTLLFTETAPGQRDHAARTQLYEPFVSFLKAIIRLDESATPRGFDDHASTIAAGRHLHDAAAFIEYDPCRLTQDHFKAAAKTAREKLAKSTAYNIGKKLVIIADWANRYNVTTTQIDFKNPNPRDDSWNARVGKEADARREDKLPTDEQLDALARIANLVEDEPDVVRMRGIELLVCGGWRINEMLTIPEDCEVYEPAYKGGQPVLDANGRHVVHYGIRYWGEKGAPPLPKWIPTPLVDVAKRAVADIRRITQPSRDAVTWMQANPGFLPLPGFATFETNEKISTIELAKIFGFHREAINLWCRNNHIALIETPQRSVKKADVVRVVRAMLPEISADSPLKLSEYLFLVPNNFFHAKRSSIPATVRFVTDGAIGSFIGGHRATKSIFDKFESRDAKGQRVAMNSHQFRHWLNTLAQNGGMNDHELARWSGRKRVEHNAAYDHVSGVQLAERIRAVVAAGSIKGPLAKLQAALPPRERAEFLEAHIATAHVTDIGLCVHDWGMLPCMQHGACAGCGEHLIVKGDAKQFGETKRLLDETKHLLAKAEEEVAEETYGAPRWVETHRRSVTSLEAIVAAHMDASIQDGTMVQIEPPAGR